MSTESLDNGLFNGNMTDAEKEQLEEAENTSWTSYISKAIIFVKCIVVTLFLIHTFVAWLRTKEQMKQQALRVRQLVMTQCVLSVCLLLGATTFEFALHYTHFYLALFVMASFVFYGHLYIILQIGAVDLKDVAVLRSQMNPLFITFFAFTALVGLNGAIRHDYSAWCIPHTYFPLIEIAKLLNLIWNLISFGIYLKTIRFKSEELAKQHAHESEETQEKRRIYEGMFASYNCYCVILFVIRIVVSLIGRFLIKKKGWVVCSDNGLRWMFINQAGTIFLTTHVALLFLVCVMTKQIFGMTALKIGLVPGKKPNQEKEMEEVNNEEAGNKSIQADNKQ